MLKKFLIAVGLVVGLASVEAQAQFIVGDNVGNDVQASWNTASAGTVSLRSPGRMVTRARQEFNGLHGTTIIRSRFGPQITETAPPITQEQQVRVQVIQTLFDNLNTALQAWLASIRLGTGLPPATGGTGNGLTDLLGNITGPI